MRLKPNESKKVLLETVREIGSEARMIDIAKQAGYSSKTPIWYHFGSLKILLKTAGFEVDEESTKSKLIRVARELGPEASGTEILKRIGFKSNAPLLDHFGTVKNLLEAAGFNIKSGKERLIIAAKKLGVSATRKEISREAGFLGNGAITHHFANLNNLFKCAGVERPNSIFDNIEFSREDERFKVKIPDDINEDVAEETGIHLGDGHCSVNKLKSGGHRYNIVISGNLQDEIPFYNQHVKMLIKRLYNKNVKPRKLGSGTYGISFRSKAIFMFKTKVLGLPNGKKTHICKIPKIILDQGEDVTKSCIRGIIDTDFCLEFADQYKVPVISGSSASKELIIQLESILKSLGFDPKVELFRQNGVHMIHRIRMYGKQMLEKYVSDIGFHNPKHLTKYQVWKEFGFCPPRTSLNDRILILKGEKEIAI